MFGIFGETGFDAEIRKLDGRAEKIVNKLIDGMNKFDPLGQMNLLQEMVKVCDQQIPCCKKYGKTEHIKKYEEEKNKYFQFHG